MAAASTGRASTGSQPVDRTNLNIYMRRLRDRREFDSIGLGRRACELHGMPTTLSNDASFPETPGASTCDCFKAMLQTPHS